jgi:hypothetical protein
MQLRESCRAFAARQADGGVLQGRKADALAQLQGIAAKRVQGAAGRPPRRVTCRRQPVVSGRGLEGPPGHHDPASTELLVGLPDKRALGHDLSILRRF